jgi:hypothetical protein
MGADLSISSKAGGGARLLKVPESGETSVLLGELPGREHQPGHLDRRVEQVDLGLNRDDS